MRLKHLFPIPIIFYAFPFVSHAIEPTPFIGFKSGWQFADDSSYQHTAPSNYLLGLYGGLQFTSSLSWDVGYNASLEMHAKSRRVDIQLLSFEYEVIK